jgi:hypothetical protein
MLRIDGQAPTRMAAMDTTRTATYRSRGLIGQ